MGDPKKFKRACNFHVVLLPRIMFLLNFIALLCMLRQTQKLSKPRKMKKLRDPMIVAGSGVPVLQL